MKSLRGKQLLVMGGALFSMHFGASCMLYPMTWGKESGSAVYLAYIGVFLSGILITLLGYTALARGNDSFWGLTKRIAPRFGTVLCSLVVLLVGPVYVIPRMSASAWDAILQLMGREDLGLLPMVLFNLAIYAIIFWFIAGKVKVTDRIGKILTPIQVLIVLAVVVKGVITPISATMAPPIYEEPAFVYGFSQAYATGDLLCALLFGAVLVGDLQKNGLSGNKLQKSLVSVGVVGLGILALIHLGHMVVGAHIGDTLPLMYSALYAQAAIELWGQAGGILFAVALVTAVISCGVGLTASSAEFFAAMGHQEKRFNGVVAVTCAISAAISCLGLNEIIDMIGPLLDACYPSTILLVVYYTFMPKYELGDRQRGLRWSMVVAFAFGLLHVLYVYNGQYGFQWDWFDAIYTKIPLAVYNFAWLPASAIAFLAGILFRRRATLQG